MSGTPAQLRRIAVTLALTSLAAACQGSPPPRSDSEPDNRAAIALLQGINSEAQQCWRGQREFRPYKVIPELDTRYGRPRILLVRAEAPQGLPQLVIEAEGTPARLSSYGPLAVAELGQRIEADVTRWAGGGKGCEA